MGGGGWNHITFKISPSARHSGGKVWRFEGGGGGRGFAASVRRSPSLRGAADSAECRVRRAAPVQDLSSQTALARVERANLKSH